MSATINDSVFDTIQRIRVEQEKKKKELEFVKRTLNLGAIIGISTETREKAMDAVQYLPIEINAYTQRINELAKKL